MAIEIRTDLLPKLTAPDVPKRNLFAAGLSAGVDNVQGMLGSAIGGLGGLVGVDAVRDFGRNVSLRNQQEAAQNGRPDLEVAPWQDGGAAILPWLAFQTTKQLPMIAGAMLATRAVPARATTGALADFGAALPKALGGGGMRGVAKATATTAERDAANLAGQAFARRAVGSATFGGALGYGSMLEEARAASPTGEVSTKDNLTALAAAPFYGALDAMDLNILSGVKNIAQKEGFKGLVRKIAAGSALGAAAELPQEGLQTAMEQSFRTDLTVQQKLANIVEGAVTGAAVGGTLGGIASVRSPDQVNEQELETRIDAMLGLPAPATPSGPEISDNAPPVVTDTLGRTASSIDDILRAGNEPDPGSRVAASFAPMPVPEIPFTGTVQPKLRPIPFVRKTDLQQTTGGPFASAPHEALSNMATTMERYLADKDPTQFTDRDLKVLDQYEQVAAELEFRASNGIERVNPVAPDATGVVERGAAQAGGQDRDTAAASTPEPFSIDTALKGISTRKAYKDVASEDELRARLTARLEQGSTAKGDVTLAERLGIDISAPAAANDVAPAKSATPAPAAPASTEGGDQSVDADFQTQWAQRLKGDVKAGVTGLRGVSKLIAKTPANAEEAKLAIYDALGATITEDSKNDGFKGVETLAREFGLTDADGQLTEEGVRIARQRIPLEASATAARAAGFTGADINEFDRGARGDPMGRVNSVAAWAAHTKGREWAQDRKGRNAPIPLTATNAQTEAVVEGSTAKAGGGRTFSSADIPQAVKDQRQLNLAVDEVYGAQLDPKGYAQLKRLVRSGAAPEVVDAAAAQLRADPNAVVIPQPVRAPFKGEVVTRGLMNSRSAQARRAALDAERIATAKHRAGFASLTSTEQAQFVEDKAQLRANISDAFANGEITGPERIGLIFQLTRGESGFAVIRDRLSNAMRMDPLISPDNPIRDQARWVEVMTELKDIMARMGDTRDTIERADREGNTMLAEDARARLAEAHAQRDAHEDEWGEWLDQWTPVVTGQVSADTALSGEGVRAAQVSRREFLAGVAAVAATGLPDQARAKVTITQATPGLEQQIKVGNAAGALRQIAQHSTNAGYRALAAKLARADWRNVRLNVLADDAGLRGLTTLEDDGSSRIDIFGKDGMNEQTLLHEMVHAFVQQRWAGIGVYSSSNKRLLKDAIDRDDKLINDFRQMWRHISSALEQRHPDLVENAIFAHEIWSDPDEMLSWAMTNPDAQAFLRTIDRDGKPVSNQPSLWDNFIKWLTELFGGTYNPKVATALDEIMAAGHAVLDAGQKVQAGDFSKKMAAGLAVQRAANLRGEFREDAPHIAEISNAQVKDTVDRVVKAAENVGREGVVGKLREHALSWVSVHGANEFWGKWFDLSDGRNGAKSWEKALNEKNAIAARLSLMFTDARDAFGALERKNKDSAEATVRLMTATEFGINPTKPWKEQAEKIREHKNKANLERVHKEYYDLYRKLLQRGHADVYQSMRDVNEVQMLATMSVSLHQQVDVDGHAKGRIPEYATPPMDDFMAAQASGEFSAADARAWWAQKLSVQRAALAKHLADQRSVIEQNATDPETEGLKTSVSDLGQRLLTIGQTVQQLEDAPYFHLGRYGNYFLGWRVPDSDALGKIGDALAEQGFNGVISDGTDKLKVYMRLESPVAQKRLAEVLEELQAQGLVEAESLVYGKRTKENFSGGFGPQWANQMIANIEADNTLDPDVKEMEINALRSFSVDLMPEMALARVMTHREGVPGYSPDMMRSFDWRGQVSVHALANAAVSPKITQSFVDMRAALEDANRGKSGADVNQREGMRDYVDEMSRRERERSMWPETKMADQLSSISTGWFLGFSASYGFVNMTQLGATLLPELGSKHGFVASAKAIAKATPVAFKIMKEVAKHGLSISLSRAQDAVITQDALRKVVGKGTAEYIMRVANTGNLDIGGPARELARSAEGRGDGKVDQVLRYASSVGYYTETMSRLIAAIATRELNPKLSMERAAAEAAHVLNETMWNYSRTNQGRQFGKMGVLGAYTPLATKFLQFQAQLTEKLYREVYNAIKGPTLEGRRQARRYLQGHLAAMTVLAGSLGLPMVTALAAIYDKVVDHMFADDDDEPSNIRAAYRNWLADTLGPKIGKIVSHGGFRALGFDISSRIGEQDIVPFSRFLADRRDFKESLPDLAMRTWGAPTSLVANWLQGGEKLMDGDIIGGMARMLPNGLAAVPKAVRLTDGGFIDAAGKELPIEADAMDTMVQLFGFNPSANAEYSSARGDQAARRSLLMRDARVLRNSIIKALEGGDQAGARELIQRAIAFEQAHPKFPVVSTLGTTIAQRRRETATARATGLPLGVDPTDRAARELTAYADY